MEVYRLGSGEEERHRQSVNRTSVEDVEGVEEVEMEAIGVIVDEAEDEDGGSIRWCSMYHDFLRSHGRKDQETGHRFPPIGKARHKFKD